MLNFKRLPMVLGIVAFTAASTGCIVAPEHDHYRYYDGYRYEHGDRIDRNGHREEKWCEQHRDYDHCR